MFLSRQLLSKINSNIRVNMSDLESFKRAAAIRAVDNHVNDGNIIGVGSGSTIVYAVERLAERVKNEKLNVLCVPSSHQAKQLITKHNLPLTDLENHPILDVCIDGADEVDSNKNLIKGGGACHLLEKIVASCAKTLIIIADYTKNSKKLGDQYKKGIPIEVVPVAYNPVKGKIERSLGGTAVLRMAKCKAGPLVTDNGNFVLDWINYNQDADWKKVNTELCLIPGVVETGLFLNMASKIYFGMSDGTIKEQS